MNDYCVCEDLRLIEFDDEMIVCAECGAMFYVVEDDVWNDDSMSCRSRKWSPHYRKHLKISKTGVLKNTHK